MFGVALGYAEQCDTHCTSADGAIEIGLKNKCKESDQAVIALLKDLKQRGLLDDRLVVWGVEFGRTPIFYTCLVSITPS